MADFTFTARAENGTLQKGTISAHDKTAAIANLRSRQLQPLVLKQSRKGLNINLALPGSSGIKTKDLVIFTRQFSTMISAGVPILRSLTTLREQSDSPALKTVLEVITAEVQGGSSLSAAMSKHPKAFSDVYVNMVRAGEAGGILDKILDRLATQVEKDSQIKSKLRGAMVYPTVICTVAIAAVVFLMVSIIPKLLSVLQQNGGKLPLQTKIIIGISNTLIHDWVFMILGLICIVVAFRTALKNPKGKYFIHKVELKLPIFGVVILKANVARFARTFSSLMGAGVSVIESLEVTAGSLGNVVVKQAIESAIGNIKNGRNIADSLDEGHILPKIVIQMAAVGEETGKMDTVLVKVAEFYEQEVDTIVSSISSIIEPVLIVFLGGIVALIAASVIGPITSLQSSVGG